MLGNGECKIIKNIPKIDFINYVKMLYFPSKSLKKYYITAFLNIKFSCSKTSKINYNLSFSLIKIINFIYLKH